MTGKKALLIAAMLSFCFTIYAGTQSSGNDGTTGLINAIIYVLATGAVGTAVAWVFRDKFAATRAFMEARFDGLGAQLVAAKEDREVLRARVDALERDNSKGIQDIKRILLRTARTGRSLESGLRSLGPDEMDALGWTGNKHDQ